jgi:hypothetical protein
MIMPKITLGLETLPVSRAMLIYNPSNHSLLHGGWLERHGSAKSELWQTKLLEDPGKTDAILGCGIEEGWMNQQWTGLRGSS